MSNPMDPTNIELAPFSLRFSNLHRPRLYGRWMTDADVVALRDLMTGIAYPEFDMTRKDPEARNLKGNFSIIIRQVLNEYYSASQPLSRTEEGTLLDECRIELIEGKGITFHDPSHFLELIRENRVGQFPYPVAEHLGNFLIRAH